MLTITWLTILVTKTRVQCTKVGESSLDFFSRFNLLATSFTLLELVKLDLPFIIVLLPYIHFHSTGYWFLLLFDKTVHQPRKQLAIWPIRRRIWTFGGNSRVGIEAVLTFWTFWKICRLDPRGWAKLRFLQPVKVIAFEFKNTIRDKLLTLLTLLILLTWFTLLTLLTLTWA